MRRFYGRHYTTLINMLHYCVNELYSLLLEFSAFGLLQNIRNNFHS